MVQELIHKVTLPLAKPVAWVCEPLKAVFGKDSLTAYRRSILWE
jgi:hypothetical protein